MLVLDPNRTLVPPWWKGLWIYICIIYHKTWWASPETLLLFDLTAMSISILNVHWPELVSSWSYSIFTRHVSLYFPPLLSWLPLLYPPNEDTSIQMTAILHATAKYKWVSSEHRPLRWLLFILGLPPRCALRINAPTIHSPFGSLHKRHDWSNWVHNSGSECYWYSTWNVQPIQSKYESNPLVHGANKHLCVTLRTAGLTSHILPQVSKYRIPFHFPPQLLLCTCLSFPFQRLKNQI